MKKNRSAIWASEQERERERERERWSYNQERCADASSKAHCTKILSSYGLRGQ